MVMLEQTMVHVWQRIIRHCVRIYVQNQLFAIRQQENVNVQRMIIDLSLMLMMINYKHVIVQIIRLHFSMVQNVLLLLMAHRFYSSIVLIHDLELYRFHQVQRL